MHVKVCTTLPKWQKERSWSSSTTSLTRFAKYETLVGLMETRFADYYLASSRLRALRQEWRGAVRSPGEGHCRRVGRILCLRP